MLSISTLAATGCGKGGSQATNVEGTATASAATSAKIDNNGKPITDFDEFVNGEWEKQKEQAGRGSDLIWWDEKAKVDEKLKEILENTDLEKIDEQSGLYKAISIYRNILDTTDYDERIASAKEHLKAIEDANTLDDIYKLYQSDEYMLYSGAFKFAVSPDDNGYNVLFFSPDSMTGRIEFQKDLLSGTTSDNPAREQLLTMMEKLGYSEARTSEIMDNASIVGRMIDDYWNEQVESTVHYYDAEALEKESLSVPVMEILENTGSFGKNKYFIAKDNFGQAINKIYQEDNLEAIRDHMLFVAINKLLTICGGDVIKEAYGTEYSDVAYIAISDYAVDVLNEAYKEKYLGDFNEPQALDMIEDIKDSYRDIIDNADWLGTHGKELAKHKIQFMRVSLGKNELENDLSDVNLTGNIVDDYISLLASKEHFDRSQVGKEDEDRKIVDADMFDVNARFLYANNAIYVTSGLLSSPNCSKAASYEEMLGYFGSHVAHEYGHSYDPKGINYDWRGWWETWMTEDEESAYLDNQQKITDFFDGMEAQYGRKIDGNLVKNETFADLMAIRCCLNILEKRENPDYDLFFRTYAARNACYITEDEIDSFFTDNHLLGKERVNFVLGQFDKFYEVYDIDESSPYYVPKEKRLHKGLL